MNHPFVDGKKRTAYVAMRAFLILNDWDIKATVDDAEKAFLELASGTRTRETFTEWLKARVYRSRSSEL